MVSLIPKNIKISRKTQKFMVERIEKYRRKPRNLMENTIKKISGKTLKFNFKYEQIHRNFWENPEIFNIFSNFEALFGRCVQISGKTPKFSIFFHISV